jgi:spore germination cell wall hydrolase CwlJ-like protein
MNELRETLLKLPAPEVLALNAYFEAAAEYKPFGPNALVGPMAVVLNRWQHPNDWQESIQEVVAAYRQFSWTNWDTIKDPQYPQALRFAKTLLAGNEVDSPIFLAARDLALAMLQGRASNPVNNSTFYYNPKVCNPAWAKALKEITVIGHHRFMAAPGDPAVMWNPAVNYLEGGE